MGSRFRTKEYTTAAIKSTLFLNQSILPCLVATTFSFPPLLSPPHCAPLPNSALPYCPACVGEWLTLCHMRNDSSLPAGTLAAHKFVCWWSAFMECHNTVAASGKCIPLAADPINIGPHLNLMEVRLVAKVTEQKQSTSEY